MARQCWRVRMLAMQVERVAPRTVGAQISWRTDRIPAHAGRGGAVPAETICQRGSCTTISAEDSTWYPTVIHPVSVPHPLTASPLALRFPGKKIVRGFALPAWRSLWIRRIWNASRLARETAQARPVQTPVSSVPSFLHPIVSSSGKLFPHGVVV